jgi:hypothetical protein
MSKNKDHTDVILKLGGVAGVAGVATTAVLLKKEQNKVESLRKQNIEFLATIVKLQKVYEELDTSIESLSLHIDELVKEFDSFKKHVTNTLIGNSGFIEAREIKENVLNYISLQPNNEELSNIKEMLLSESISNKLVTKLIIELIKRVSK